MPQVFRYVVIKLAPCTYMYAHEKNVVSALRIFRTDDNVDLLPIAAASILVRFS